MNRGGFVCLVGCGMDPRVKPEDDEVGIVKAMIEAAG